VAIGETVAKWLPARVEPGRTVRGNEVLFMLLGNSYGGDGRTNFALPDLRKALPAVATDNDKYLRYCIAVRGDFPRRP